MKFYIQNKQKSEINLTDRDFITEGGEGKIYGKDNTIFKFYFDVRKIICQAKIDELKTLEKFNISHPQFIVLNSRYTPVGIAMNWAKNTVSLCKLFTNDFRKRFNIAPKLILELVNNMVKDIQFIHDKKCLIVDGSEMNYLIDFKKFSIPYFIDVDSYQTPHFSATAITPTIKDYHARGFSELTDWFSFAIICFQLFIGIHPYKGTHPKYKKYELEKRMKDNVSVFHSGVKLPSTARDFSYIPDNYRNWFIKMFEKGERLFPPIIVGRMIVAVKSIIIKSTDSFDLILIKELPDDIIRFESGVIFTGTKVYYNKLETSCNSGTDVIFTKHSLTPIFVDIENIISGQYKLRLRQINGELVFCNLDAIAKTIINGMLFVFNNDYVIEVDIDEMNSKFFPLIKSQWNVLPKATKLFNGIIYQSILGVPYFMIPHKLPNGKTSCYIKPIPELKRFKILEVKHDLGIVMVVGHKSNKYTRFIFKFDDNYSQYNCRIENDIIFHVPNFITLDNGIVICITVEDVVEVFSKELNKNEIKRIQDENITFDMKLCKKGVDAYVRKNNGLFKFSMKNDKRKEKGE